MLGRATLLDLILGNVTTFALFFMPLLLGYMKGYQFGLGMLAVRGP